MRYIFILLLFYSFNNYVNLLDEINKNKPFPDINDIDE